MLKNTDWHYPAPIYFGEGRIKEIGRLCHSLEMTDPLIITDTNLKDMPFCLTLLESLEKENITYRIFTDFSPNPTDLNIHAGNETFNQRKHDGIIVLGGGSAIDVAKTIALTAGQSHPLWDFEDVGDNYLRADTNKIIKTIAIPTTAGTGSEVGRASVIVDTQAQTKRLIFHPLMLPKAVILDPSTTLTVPPHLTAATGMDAFAHSLEAFLAPTFHPMSNGIALEGMRLIKENLPKAYQDGSNIEARGNLLIASTMGATAFQKGLGLIHSLSHPVGAMYHQHHGLLNALFMPYSLLFNRSHIEAHATIIARHLSLPSHDFDGLFNFVVDFIKMLNLPLSLKEINIDDKKASEVAQKAFNDPSTASNPKPLTEIDIKRVYLKAIRGELT